MDSEAPAEKRRRRPSSRHVVAALLACGLLCVGWSLVEPHLLVVHEEHLALEAWPRDRPVRVAALSDLHVGSPGMHLSDLRVVVERTNALEPDLVALLGDYVPGRDDTAEHIRAMAEELGHLRAKHGVFAVLGNHDYWTDGASIRAALTENGVRVLVNEAVKISLETGPIYVGGMDDLWTGHADVERVLAQVPEGAPLLGLVHEPDLFAKLSPRFTLLLAGHTHGGQVRLPIVGRLVVPSVYGQRYAAGWIQEEGRSLFVTTGLGTSIAPVRFGVPPEIALLSISAVAF